MGPQVPVSPARPVRPTRPLTPWWGFRPGSQRRVITRRMPTERELRGLDGLGKWLKKQVKSINRIAAKPLGLISKRLEKNVVKIGDKLADNADSLHTKINTAAKKAGKSIKKFVKKNLKWIVIAAAIAITIYSMGSGATIAAKMISGCKAIAAKVGSVFTGSAAAGSGGATVATTGATTAATTAASTAATTTASTSLTSGIMGKLGSSALSLALTAGTKLVGGSKCSELSEEERLAYGEAADAGILPMNAELAHGMGLGMNPAQGFSEGMAFPGGNGGAFGSGMPSWVMPAAIGAGALVLVMALKK